MIALMQVRPSQPTDRPFLIELARLACALEGHPLPAGGDPEVLAILPGQTDAVVVATDDAGQPIGGAWWHLHSPPLVRDAGGQAVPEVVMAVLEVARGRGVGAALIEALVQEASRRSVSALALNVHLANPAARLYMRTGFRVAGAGRGWFGVAMVRALGHDAQGKPAEIERVTGFHSVTPRMVVNDVIAQVEFLRAVFDATGEVQADRPAELRLGNSLVMVSAAGERDLFPAFLYVYVDDADATFRRALAAGAVGLEEPRNTPYGDRRAMVRDPFGNVFQIAHRSTATRP